MDPMLIVFQMFERLLMMDLGVFAPVTSGSPFVDFVIRPSSSCFYDRYTKCGARHINNLNGRRVHRVRDRPTGMATRGKQCSVCYDILYFTLTAILEITK